MKTRQRMAVILTIFCLTAVLAIALSPQRARADDNVVRLLLTRLALTDRLEVSLDGSYTLGDIAFQRGSRLTISCASGSIMVYYEGMALDAGKQVKLLRHADAEELENGLRLNDAYALHRGDLSVTVVDGALQAVLHTPMEEYLLGVVPYEMSDSFPLEALKAQAIAARTYAMSKLGSAGDYDLVDNTNDQSYRGYNAANTNAEQAVAATRGICGYYQGNLGICYYTASNGGQTELVENVWKRGGDYGYLARTDDPYDAENPESVVRRASLQKLPAGGVVGNQALTDYLLAQLSEPMEAMGYSGEKEDIVITGVRAAQAHTPAFGKDSRVFTQLRLDLAVSGKRLSAQGAEEEVNLFTVTDGTSSPAPDATTRISEAYTAVERALSVDVPIFGALEEMLGLSINADNNELLTVTEGDTAFTVETRRYGHGVGMSQRGAQWMAAQYGWTCEQILRFYYPGLTFKTARADATLRPAVAAKFLTTPGPAATPTPRPTPMPATGDIKAGEWRVKVTQIAENSSLNMRDEPNTQGKIVRILYYGQELIASGRTQDGWIKVRTDVLEGYVMEKFVEAVQ